MEDVRYFNGDYDFLSNFYLCPVEYKGILYPSAEHAYQATKFLDKNIKIFIGSATSPAQAKKYGRAPGIREDWEDIKVRVMYELLQIKFQIPELRKKLLATEDSHLEEGNWWGDTFWGICRGKGQNVLGKLLMKVRKELCEI